MVDPKFIVNTKQVCFWSMIWTLVMTSVIFIPNVSPWIATPLVLVGIIAIPGLLFLLILKIKSDDILQDVLYAIGLGLSFLLIGGLGINWMLPYLGVLQPLARLPLVLFFDSTIILLTAITYYFNKDYVVSYALSQPSDKTNLFLGIIPWIFVILSACGAELLNNGGTGTLTLVMLFGIAAYAILLIARRQPVQPWIYVSALYSISLSLLLMYSLRSNHILGWDINLEYQVFQATLKNLIWKISYYPGLDYNACLSITIVPTIFKELTNMPSEYVFKITFQLLFATLPVMVYMFAKKYLKDTLAFLAAFLVLSQTWFFEQMPALIRQELLFSFI